VLFKGVSVFDRSQVNVLESGTPTPLEAPGEPWTGDSHAHLLEPLVVFAATLGYSVSLRRSPGRPAVGVTRRPSGSSWTPARRRTRGCAR